MTSTSTPLAALRCRAPASVRAGSRRRASPRCAAADGRPSLPPLLPPRAPAVAVPPARSVAPPPSPVPIEHSSAYALRHMRPAAPEQAPAPAPAARGARDDEEGVVAWALRSADEQLAAIEKEPPAAARAAWVVSAAAAEAVRHPGVQAAAKLTATVSADVLRAAAPVGARLGAGAMQLAWRVLSQRGRSGGSD